MISQKRIEEIKKFFELEEGFENKTLDRHVNLKEFEHLQILRRDFESEAVVAHELLSAVESLREENEKLKKDNTEWELWARALASQADSIKPLLADVISHLRTNQKENKC